MSRCHCETADAELSVLHCSALTRTRRQRTGRKSWRCNCDPCADSAFASADRSRAKPSHYSARARIDHQRELITPTTQYIQKDELVEPPQIVIKLRKARTILYTGLRTFWLIQIIFWRALSVVAVDYAAEQLVQPLRLPPQLEQHHHAFDAL
jgi:hypothetical protein